MIEVNSTQSVNGRHHNQSAGDGSRVCQVQVPERSIAINRQTACDQP